MINKISLRKGKNRKKSMIKNTLPITRSTSNGEKKKKSVRQFGKVWQVERGNSIDRLQMNETFRWNFPSDYQHQHRKCILSIVIPMCVWLHMNTSAHNRHNSWVNGQKYECQQFFYAYFRKEKKRNIWLENSEFIHMGIAFQTPNHENINEIHFEHEISHNALIFQWNGWAHVCFLFISSEPLNHYFTIGFLNHFPFLTFRIMKMMTKWYR